MTRASRRLSRQQFLSGTAAAHQYRRGESVAAIPGAWRDLTAGQVRATLSCCFDHQRQIDQPLAVEAGEGCWIERWRSGTGVLGGSP